mgnify:CR=1 FL=1
MKRILIPLMVLALSVPAFAAENVKKDKGGAAMTEPQNLMYFLGQAISSKVKTFDFTKEEQEYIIKGFSDYLTGKSNLDDKARTDEYNKKLNEYFKTKMEAAVKKEKEKGTALIEKLYNENKGKAEKLQSGMLYIPVKEGTGAAPKADDVVKVNYHGTFADGKVFDSSKDRGEPATFQLNGVIPCWTEGVQKMKVGGEAKLVCPSDTAYGDVGAGGVIPGGAALIFDVELIEIEKGDNPVAESEDGKAVPSGSDAEQPDKSAVKPAKK